MSDIDNILEKAHRARLIPTIADSQKEERLVSVLLATLAVVHPFAKQLLERCGVKMGKTSKLLSYTEVKFPSLDENNKRDEDRPDGLLILSTGKSQWKALVEAKIDNVEIDKEQVDRYAKTARDIRNRRGDHVVESANAFANAYPVYSSESAQKSR